MADTPVGPYQIPKISSDDPVSRVAHSEALAVAVNAGLGQVAGQVTDLGPAYAPSARSVPANGDMNTYRTPGISRIRTPDTATILNLPPGMRSSGVVQNITTGDGTDTIISQVVQEMGTGARSWWRAPLDDGLFGPWSRPDEQNGPVTEWHVFLAVGQSNMSGRGIVDTPGGGRYVSKRIGQYGFVRRVVETATVPLDMHDTATGLSPATTFARTYLREQAPHVGVLIVPAAHGGTGFTTSTTTYTWTPGIATNPTYDLPGSAVTQTQAAITAAKATGAATVLKGILWHQGEDNSTMSTTTYATNLDALIAYFRAQLAAPNLPFIVGQMSPEGITATTGRVNVDTAHQQTPGRVAYTGFAPAVTGGYNPGDTTHLSRLGVDFLGGTYAEAFESVQIAGELRVSNADQGARLNGRTIPDNTDLHTIAEQGWHRLLQFAPSNINAPETAIRGDLHVSVLSVSGRILKFWSYESSPRLFVKTMVASVWGAWKEFNSNLTNGGRVIAAATQDFHALTETGVYMQLGFAPDYAAQNMPTSARGALSVQMLNSTNRLLEYNTYELSPRKFQQALVTGVWGPWKETGAGAGANGGAGQASGLKVVPLQLTLGTASQTDGPLTGTFRYPAKFGAPVLRARLCIQNVHPSSGTVKTGSVSFTGVWLGKHSGNGAYPSLPTKVQNAFTTPTDGSVFKTGWFPMNSTPGVEDLFSVGYTASNGTVFSAGGSGWTNASPSFAGNSNPTLTAAATLPFYMWLEAETYAETPHAGVMGDSLSSGVSAGGVQNSMLSQYCLARGILPTHYSNSGDTLESWALNPNHYKWKVWEGLAVPDAMIIAGGSNDLNGTKTVADIQGYFVTVADAFRAMGVPNIYAANITPRSTSESATFEANRRAYNTWLAGLPGGVREMFNFRDAVSADDETLLAAYDADGVHLNAAGYAAQAAKITTPITSPPFPVLKWSEAVGRTLRVQNVLTGADQLVYGDTGVREITSLVANVVSGKVWVRRVGSTVTFTLDNLITTQADGASVVIMSNPDGFRPDVSAHAMTVHPTQASMRRVMLTPGGGVQMYNYVAATATIATLTYQTNNAWPTALPGVASGVISTG